MTSNKFLAAGLLLFILSSISQSQSFVPNPPTWYVQTVDFFALVKTNGTQTGGSIKLFRSGGRLLSDYIIYNSVRCTQSQNLTETPLKDGWMGCQEYTDAPPGERELRPDVYERLKWRFVDLKYYNGTSNLERVTVQVVNALPANVYVCFFTPDPGKLIDWRCAQQYSNWCNPLQA
jgi:hypothetical protein